MLHDPDNPVIYYLHRPRHPLPADLVDALNLDSTGRDGNDRFPYTWGNLTQTERTTLLALHPLPAPAGTPDDRLPRPGDLVTTTHLINLFEQRPGMVREIRQQPHIRNGEQYLVEFADGFTHWYWRDQLRLLPPEAFHPVSARIQLDQAATALFEVIANAEYHDPLREKLTGIYEELSTIVRDYLPGGDQ